MRGLTCLTLAVFAAAWIGCGGDDDAATTGPSGAGAEGGAGAQGGGPGSGGMPGVGGAGGTGGSASICGDGMLGGIEQCDDGNTATGDGCDDACATETGWDCDGGSPSQCSEICGDGLVVGSEACDDGNTDADDGCDGTCQVEFGWSCSGEPSTCMTGCGDGIRVGTEECDDGNTDDSDGCSAACTVESGWVCIGDQPSACELLGSCDHPVVVTGDGFTWQAPNLLAYGDDIALADASCVSDDGDSGSHPDVVFEVALNAGETLRVTDAGSLDVVMHLMDGPCATATACLASFEGSNTTEATIGLLYSSATQQTVYVVIDTYFDNPTSTQDVDLLFEISQCGDGLIGPGEGCDDGNTADSDGCSAVCQPDLDYHCTGEPSVCVVGTGTCLDPIQVTVNQFQFSGTNIQQHVDDQNYGSGPNCVATSSVAGGYDVVFEVPLSAGETVIARDLGSLDAVMHILTAGQCSEGTTCEASTDGGETTGISYTASANETVYVVLESWGNPSPSTTYDFRIDIVACGNGRIDFNEACDDGNTANADGCSSTCGVEPGFECAGEPSVCTALPAATCAEPIVATGPNFQFNFTNIPQFGDDESFNGLPGCATHSSSGTPPELIFRADLLAGETIRVSEHGTLDTIFNILEPGQCTAATACVGGFDNQEVNGVLYTAQANGPVYISVESWSGSPSTTQTGEVHIDWVSVCGNGVVEAHEQCDDGNPTNGDGCSSVCMPEATTLLTGCSGTVVAASAGPMPVGIPNNTASGGAIFTIPISASGNVQSMVMSFTAQHTGGADIDVWLTGPMGGGELDVSTDNGNTSGPSYVGTLFDDLASTSIASASPPFIGAYQPEQPFSAFTGQSVNGNWVVRVADDSGLFDHGVVNQLDLAFCVTP